MTTALILIAHGSRQASANDDLVALAQSLESAGDYDFVRPSFLELAEPDIPTACRKAVSDGAARVIMLPYFLSAGVHVRRDLTGFRDELARENPAVEFLLAEPLGRHPLLRDVVRQRAREAVANLETVRRV